MAVSTHRLQTATAASRRTVDDSIQAGTQPCLATEINVTSKMRASRCARTHEHHSRVRGPTIDRYGADFRIHGLGNQGTKRVEATIEWLARTLNGSSFC